MALKAFNSIGGFSVGENQDIAIDANLNITSANITASGNIAAGNISLTGNVDAANLNVSEFFVANVIATGNANIAGWANVVGNLEAGNISAATGNLTVANITGNVYAGAFLSDTYLWANGDPFIVDAYSNANVQAFLSSGNVTDMTASGNVVGGNFNTAGLVSATGDILSGAAISATGNAAAANFNTAGLVSATGDILSGAAISATGNATAANFNTAGIVDATSGATFGGAVNVTGAVSASGNVTSGNGIVSGGDISAAGTVWSQNVVASAAVSAIGNVIGANFNTTGEVATGSLTTTAGASVGSNLLVGGWANVTGDLVSQNVQTGIISATGNINAGSSLNVTSVANVGSLEAVGTASVGNNLSVAGDASVTGALVSGAANVASLEVVGAANIGTTLLVNSTGNIVGGLTVGGTAQIDGALTVSNDALITGNLTVDGNVIYVNVETLVVEDPLIDLGTGPNGAPLVANDGKDRGALLEYYTSAPVTAWMGWKNNAGQFQFGSNVSVANDVVTINELGNIVASTVFANLQGATVSTTGNISTGADIVANGNIYGANLDIAGTFNAGTITANNFTASGNLSATGNIITSGNMAFAGNGTLTGGTVQVSAVIANTTQLTNANAVYSDTLSRFVTVANVAANITSVTAGFGAAIDFSVVALDAGSGNVYRFLVSTDSQGDYTITNNVGASLGAASVILDTGVLYLNVTPVNSNSITWTTKTSILT